MKSYSNTFLLLNLEVSHKPNKMLEPIKLIEKAKHSPFYLKLLSWALDRMIPFNKPHAFKIVTISDFRIKIKIPYQKSNFNHIKGLHACALATISEYTTGFLLLSKLDGNKYRLIMKRLEMDYHYQGKLDAFAEFEVSSQWLEQQIYEPLKIQDSVLVICEVKIHDAKQNHLTTGKVHWQVKDWAKVKTK